MIGGLPAEESSWTMSMWKVAAIHTIYSGRETCSCFYGYHCSWLGLTRLSVSLRLIPVVFAGNLKGHSGVCCYFRGLTLVLVGQILRCLTLHWWS